MYEEDVTQNNIMQVFAKIAIALVEKCGDEIEMDFEANDLKYKITIAAEQLNEEEKQ